MQHLMDARTVLKREHTRMEQLFAEFDALPERACVGRRALIGEIETLVRRHFAAEEALDRRGEDDHAVVLRLLGEVSSMDCHDETYVPRALAVRELLRHHIRTEVR